MLVVSLNPAVDIEWQVDHAYREEKNQIVAERRWAGGKGANVARWLKFLGAKPRLVTPLGGNIGREFARSIQAERILLSVVPLRDETRANVLITEPTGRQMRFNRFGPKWTERDWRLARLTIQKLCQRSTSILLLGGALPQGLRPDAYAKVIRAGHRRGIKTLLDCDGPALRAALPAKPFLVKPNEYELREWAKGAGIGKQTVREQALAMSRASGGWVMVSRGARGAMLVNESKKVAMSHREPGVEVMNTLGAGDALLAGVASAISSAAPPEGWLKWGVRLGTAATQLPAGTLPKRPFKLGHD